MKVLIDTNVILDVLCERPEFVEASAEVMRNCEAGVIEGYASALSFPNIAYIMRKELTKEKTAQIITSLSMIFKVEDLKADDLKRAAKSELDDFEDALQAACAARVKADYIVTRNKRDFVRSSIPAITPAELIEKIY